MEQQDRIITPSMTSDDREMEYSLRPKTMAEYIGQEKVKEKMTIFMEAARQRNEPLDHVLLYGPPGLGKTTLAGIISNEMNVNLRVTSGPAIERAADLAAILTNLNPGDVLFIDEIHRLNHSVEEVLYPAMEDFALDIIIGKGPSARSIRIDVAPFTLVGATTRAGMLAAPLRDRFGVINRLELYTEDELLQIIKRSSQILKIELDEQGGREIARRSRGTPRVANRLMRRIRDYAQIKADGMITLQVAKDGLDLLEVDFLGLDMVDRRLLETIIYKFAGGPVGLETLAASSGEESGTIEDMHEPFLLQLGFLQRTPRGRIATPNAYRHLNIVVPKQLEQLYSQISFTEEDEEQKI